jgi:dihydrodipicolinate reductase
MTKKINITITGALGRMGQILIKCALKNKIIKLHSLTDLKEDKQLSPYIQVPEVFVKCSETDKQLILENLKYIVDGKIPIIKNINDESWEIDLTFFKGEK